MAFHKRLLPLTLGIGVAIAAGCGDSNDPDAITNLELKSPTGLSIIDKGEGKVVLEWYTSNPEEDFEGYNVYGAAVSDLTAAGVTEGDPVKLLGTDGAEDDTVKETILPAFDYSTTNTNALPNAPVAIAAQEDENTLSRLPIHSQNAAGDAALLPTCRPAKTAGAAKGTCTFVSEANSNTEKDAADISSNGIVQFDLYGSAGIQLTEGTQYCFFVLSSQNDGKEVSESSSNVACVTPRYKKELSWTPGNSSSVIDLRGAIADSKCASHACDISIASAATSSTTSYLALEAKNSGGGWSMSASNNGYGLVYIKRMGVYENGFDDLKVTGGAMSLDTNNVKNGNSYGIAKQSEAIIPKGMYAIAVDAGTAASTSSTYYYFYLWVSGDSLASGTATTLELRIPTAAGQL